MKQPHCPTRPLSASWMFGLAIPAGQVPRLGISKPLIWMASLLAVCATTSLGQSSDGISPERMQEHLTSFDEVRSTIETRYPKPERLDEAWHALADSLREAVPEATSDREARQILNALAESFGESHFQIIPSDSYDTLFETEESSDGGEEGGEDDDDLDDRESDDAADAEDGDDEAEDDDEDEAPTGSSGVSIRLIDDLTVVTHVQPGSAGEKAGLRPGDAIVRFGSRQTADLLETIHSLSATSPNRIETTVAVVMQSRLTGDIDETLEIEYVRAEGDTTQTQISFQAWNGVVTQLGALPPQTVSTHSEDLGDIGLVHFSLFLAPGTVMPFIQESLERFRDKDGLVIDVRGNLGGLMPMVQGIIGWFVPEPTQLGELTMRGNDLKMFANPRPWTFDRPIAVLTDELSISSAEIFSAAMQELELAHIFGSRTAGLALPANIRKLTNGDGFLYVVADYHTARGRRLEKTGVVPDTEVEFDRTDLYRDPDPVLTAALQWLRESSKP